MNSETTNRETSIPDSLLTRLFDSSGSIDDGTKGFVLFYINDSGQPSAYSRTANPCVDMALHKLIELYALQLTSKPNQ